MYCVPGKIVARPPYDDDAFIDNVTQIHYLAGCHCGLGSAPVLNTCERILAVLLAVAFWGGHVVFSIVFFCVFMRFIGC